MYVCSSCGKTFTEPTNFCNNCGNAVTNKPAPTQYSVPYTSAQPVSRGKNIAGMIMGISGMVLALLGFLYCMIQVPNAVDGYRYRYYAEALATTALVFFFLAAPFSIVGLALSDRKAFGVVGTIFSGILLFLGIIFLGVAS